LAIIITQKAHVSHHRWFVTATFMICVLHDFPPPGGSFGEIRRTGIWRTIPVESLTTSVSRSGTYDDNCNRYVFCY